MDFQSFADKLYIWQAMTSINLNFLWTFQLILCPRIIMMIKLHGVSNIILYDKVPFKFITTTNIQLIRGNNLGNNEE